MPEQPAIVGVESHHYQPGPGGQCSGILGYTRGEPRYGEICRATADAAIHTDLIAEVTDPAECSRCAPFTCECAPEEQEPQVRMAAELEQARAEVDRLTTASQHWQQSFDSMLDDGDCDAEGCESSPLRDMRFCLEHTKAAVDRLTAERDKAVAEVWEYRRQPPDQTAVKLLGRLDAAVAERDDARDRADELERWSDSIAALAPDEFDDGTGRSQESLISAWIGHVLARLDEADENLRRVLALADRYETQGRAKSSTAVADELRAAVQGDRPAETSAEGQIGREARREIVGSGADHFGCAEAGHGTATPASSSAEPIEDLIERSSLGTPEAKRQRPEPAVDRPKRITSRDVDCPTCGATAGERCRGSAYSSRSHRAVDYHHARREAARSPSARTFAEAVTPDAD